MDKLSWFTLLSTGGALLAIAIGIIFPAQAMGRAIAQALDALARQPEAEKSITRTLFIGLGDDRVTGNLRAGHCADRAVPQSLARIPFEVDISWNSTG